MEEEVVRTYHTNPLVQLVYLILGILTTLLSLRFIFIFFGINSSAPLINLVFSLTNGLVQPFFGLLGQAFTFAGFTIDIASLIAIIVVWIVGSIIATLLRLIP